MCRRVSIVMYSVASRWAALAISTSSELTKTKLVRQNAPRLLAGAKTNGGISTSKVQLGLCVECWGTEPGRLVKRLLVLASALHRSGCIAQTYLSGTARSNVGIKIDL